MTKEEEEEVEVEEVVPLFVEGVPAVPFKAGFALSPILVAQ